MRLGLSALILIIYFYAIPVGFGQQTPLSPSQLDRVFFIELGGKTGKFLRVNAEGLKKGTPIQVVRRNLDGTETVYGTGETTGDPIAEVPLGPFPRPIKPNEPMFVKAKLDGSANFIQVGKSMEMREDLVTATLPGRSISGIVSHLPNAKLFKRAIAVFPGWDGVLQLRQNGDEIFIKAVFHIAIRPRYWWLDDSTLVLAVDAPSDKWGGGASDFEPQFFLSTKRWADDLNALMDAVEVKYGKLEWVFVGASYGAVTSFHGAKQLPGRVSRLILLSPQTDSVKVSSSGRNIALSDQRGVNPGMPTLWLSDRNDECASTSYSRAKEFAEAIKAPFVTVENPNTGFGAACDASTRHGFIGMTYEVVTLLKDWVAGKPIPDVLRPVPRIP